MPSARLNYFFPSKINLYKILIDMVLMNRTIFKFYIKIYKLGKLKLEIVVSPFLSLTPSSSSQATKGNLKKKGRKIEKWKLRNKKRGESTSSWGVKIHLAQWVEVRKSAMATRKPQPRYNQKNYLLFDRLICINNQKKNKSEPSNTILLQWNNHPTCSLHERRDCDCNWIWSESTLLGFWWTN